MCRDLACCKSGSKSLLSIVVLSYGAEAFNDSVAYYLFYEWASKVTSIAFNVCLPLLISGLGDEEFPKQGKSIWSYTSAIIQIVKALCFLTFTAYFEFGTNRKSALIYFSSSAAIALLVFIFCITPSTIYLACIAAIICHVSQSIASLAYDSLLFSAVAAAGGRESGTTSVISSKGTIIGYCSMIFFAIFAGIIILLIYYGQQKHIASLWIQGILPLFIAGVWYGGFLTIVVRGLPVDFGVGLKLEAGTQLQESTEESINRSFLLETLLLVRDAFVKGSLQQIQNLQNLMNFLDCSLYIFAFIFLTGAASVVTSVAAIVAVDILKASILDVAICAALGVFGAIFGLMFFKTIVGRGFLDAKGVLVTNTVIFIALLIFILYIKSRTELFISAVWGGTQIGSFSAFSRALYSDLVPNHKQSTFFSLLQFSQESTAWIPGIIVAAVTARYNGSNTVYLRTTIITALVEIAIGLPCLLLLNCQRGLKAKQNAEQVRSKEDFVIGSSEIDATKEVEVQMNPQVES